MSTIAELAPQSVWKHFYALTQVPRPSGYLEPVQHFLLDCGKKIGVETFMDDAGNITFTSIKGNLAGYMDWSTSSTAKVTEEGIMLVLDTGVEVLLTPKAW
jgi:dipeptidase D